MDVKDWEDEIRAAFESQGREYTSDLQALMLSSIRSATAEKDKMRAVEVTNMMQRRFWRKVVQGETFGDPTRIKQEFGKSLENNYGMTSGPFINLSRTYWTYQIELRDLFPQHHDKWISQALKAVEINIGSIFFPTPGPAQPPPRARRDIQREYLQTSAPQLDIERLLNENPMLKVDKRLESGQSRSGCMPVLVCTVITVSTLIAYAYV